MSTKYLLPALLLRQFSDSNGDPLNGGTILTEAAGTTTPKATYKDRDGAATHTNPIVLDASGRIPGGAAWGDTDSVGYKLTVKDSLGNLIEQHDDVFPIASPNDIADAAEWLAGPLPTFIDADEFSVPGDERSVLQVNRRLRLTDASTLYGTVSAAAYDGDNNITTVTVLLDSGSLSASLSALAYSILSADDDGVPRALAGMTLTTPDIDGGTADGLTSLGVRSSGSGAFDVRPRNRENLSAARSVDLVTGDADGVLSAPLLAVGGPAVGLVIKNNAGSPNSQVDVDATALGVGGRLYAPNLTMDITASGANGLDTGSEANSTWYAIWAIANITDPAAPVIAGLLSASFSAPTMPSGYTLKRLIGAVYNGSGGDFDAFKQVGNSVVISGRSFTGFGVAAATETDISAAVPPNAIRVEGVTRISASSGTVDVIFELLPESTFSYISNRASIGSSPNDDFFSMPLTTPQTLWRRLGGTNGVGDFYIYGFTIDL